MPGVIGGFAKASRFAVAIEDRLLAAECNGDDEWERQVRYLPLR